MTRKVDSRAMREVNKALLLDLIRAEQLTSRTELARRTALTKPTVSAIVDELIQADVVREVGVAPNKAGVGRKARLLQFNEFSSGYLGIHFGVHATRVAVADGRGQIRHIEQGRAVLNDPKASLAGLKPLVREALRKTPIRRDRIQAVGTTLPGLVDQETGECVLAPNLGWRGFPLRAELKKQFRVPVVVHNITQAAAVAEGKIGAARGKRSFVWVYLGSGIGSGIVDDGHLFLGTHGFSGEIGHCQVVSEGGKPCRCGRIGCLETVASGPAILDFVSEMEKANGKGKRGKKRVQRKKSAIPLSMLQRNDLADLVQAANKGDETARLAFSEAGNYLGIGISYLVNLLNPELVVLGGHVAAAGALLTEPVRESLQDRALEANTVEVVTSELGDTAGLTGAVLLAMERTTRSPRVVSLSEAATAG